MKNKKYVIIFLLLLSNLGLNLGTTLHAQENKEYLPLIQEMLREIKLDKDPAPRKLLNDNFQKFHDHPECGANHGLDFSYLVFNVVKEFDLAREQVSKYCDEVPKHFSSSCRTQQRLFEHFQECSIL